MFDRDTYGAEGGRKSGSAAPPDDFIMRPRVDVCFKRLMEDEEVRTGFLSAILDIPSEEIESAVLLPTGTLPEYGDDKLGILDVRVRLNNSSEIDIEMQMNSHAWWLARSLFYLCRMYAGQLHEGDGYEKLQKCIHIGILDFKLFDNEAYHSRFHLWEDTRRQMYTDKLEVHVLELPKIKDGAYPESKLLHWAKFLNSNTREEMKSMAVKDPYIGKAYRQVVKLSADEMARLEYEAREKAERDHDAYLKSSWLDGQKDGIEIGRRDGRAEGIEIGRKSGIEIGRKSGRRDGILFGMRISACIQNSRQEGLSDHQIISRLSERFSLKEEEAEEYMRDMELSDVSL